VVHENYYGTFRDQNDYPGQLFSSKWTTDLDLSYVVWNNVTASHWRPQHLQYVPGQIANSASNKVYATTGGLVDARCTLVPAPSVRFNGAFFYFRLAAKF